MKKPVKSEGRVSVGQFKALADRGFSLNCRMRYRKTGDLCVLGCHGSKGFWVMNLTRGTKGMFTPAELATHFQPIAEEATA